MKFRPILFSTPMVQAILENRKNQTRRTKGLEEINENPDEWVLEDTWLNVGTEEIALIVFKKKDPITCQDIQSVVIDSFPYGNVGDVLWVRESFVPGYFDDGKHGYKADWNSTAAEYVSEPKWKPSIHMPKAACRLFLRVKNVRVERLQDISESDAVNEGIIKYKDGSYKFYTKKPLKNLKAAIDKASLSFLTLWDSINAEKMPSKKNPWVWVVEFEPIDQPIEFNMPF